MPRHRLPHLQKEITRHGKIVWYFRRGKGVRVRVLGDYGSEEFQANYEAALKGETAGAKPAPMASGTLTWAVSLYRQSSAWLAFSAATKRQRENILAHILETAGGAKLSTISRAVIVAGRERRASTPAAARHFVVTMRGLFQWAVESGLVTSDPTRDVKVQRKTGDGFAPWTSQDLDRFWARWPRGTAARVACDTLYYTGLRRGDAVMLGRQHIKDGVARLATEKTGERAVIPIEPELAETWAAGPCGELSFIAQENGKPRRKEAFGNWFREACREAGVDKSAHGLRKAGATRDAERGWTESELEAKYGWSGGRMASHYTRSMDRERLAIAAAARTGEAKAGTSIPSPMPRTLGPGAGFKRGSKR